ncbi:MAG: TonB-dependent receptor [Pseudomonadota bacterium]
MRHLLNTTSALLLVAAPGLAEVKTGSIDVPAQPLDAAIKELSEQTGLPVLARTELLAGKQSQPVNGVMSPLEALQTLLVGSDLTINQLADESVVVKRNIQVSQDDTDDFELPPIIVRGELIERNLQDTQTSVTVFTGEDFERRGEPDITAALERAPNITGFNIRGIDLSGLGRGNVSLAISTQVDGVAKPDGLSVNNGVLPTWDLEQVEILRGPQSTQQGPNALAGAVILRTADPVYVNEHRIRGGAGSRDFLDGAFMVNQIVSEDRAAVRFSAQANQSDGSITNTTLDADDAAFNDLQNYRAKLRLNPADSFEAILSYQWQRTERGAGETAIDALFPSDREITANLQNDNTFTEQVASLRLSYEISDRLTLVSETGLYHYDFESFGDIGGDATDDGFSDIDDSSADSFQTDLRLLFKGDGYSGVAGFFYLDKTSDADVDNVIDTALLGIPGSTFIVNSKSKDEVTNVAVFGEVELEANRLLPGLSFTLGGRWDRESKKTSASTTYSWGFPFPVPFPDLESTVDTDYEAFLPKAGVTYEWQPGLTTSLTYQEGYRAGGVNESILGTVEEFDPEFLRNIEFAVRGEFFGGVLVTNANVFYSRWQDQQIFVLDLSTGNTVVDNAGESEMFGTELTVDYRPTGNLDLYGAIGYLQSEFLDYDTTGGDFTGNELPGAPTWTGSFGGVYQFDNGIGLGLDFSYTDEAFSTASNDPRLTSDTRFLTNANLTYERGGLLVGAYVRNLFDVDYATGRSDNARTPVVDDFYASVGEPLTVGAFLEYQF